MNGYICFFKGKRIEIYADTLYQAKQKAVEQFKAGKNNKHMISVNLAEVNGEQVTHTPDI